MPPAIESHKKQNPTPPPEKPEPPKVKLPETEAELEERRRNVEAAMWGPAPKKPDPAPEPPAAKSPPTDEPPAAPAAKTTPEKPAATEPPAAKSPPEPVDTKALITETAKSIRDEVGRALKEAKPEATPEKEEPADVELIPEDEHDAAIIAKMEELDPTQKGKADAFKAFARRRYDYEADWLAKHPGATFNPDDPEHEEFYKGQPDIDRDAFKKAEVKFLVDQEVSQKLKPIQERQEAEQKQAKTEKAFAAHAPVIEKNLKSRIVETVEAVNPEVAKLLKGMNPLALTKEDVEKLEDEDSIVSRVMGPLVFQEMVPLLVELEKSVTPDAEYEIDPKKNKVHAEIAKFVAQFETEQSANPTKRDGKEFITIAEFDDKQREIAHSKASAEAKQRKLRELQSRYWTATVDDVQETIVKDISKRAKATVDDLDGMARRKYKKEAKPAAPKSPAEPAATESPNVQSGSGKPRPPSVASQATVVDTSRSGQTKAKSFGETAVEVHWGT